MLRTGRHGATEIERRSSSPISENYSRRSCGSAPSDKSYLSQSTIPTDYEYITSKTDQHLDDSYVLCHDSWSSPFDDAPKLADKPPRLSVETYASTTSSLKVQEAAPSDIQLPRFHPDDCYDFSIPTTPSDFNQLFPSARKLCISHDESTPDGNMNLKVNTEVRTLSGRLQMMTLFHLRMYDLKSREFSLRRYDRDSGREVCHSVRKFYKPSDHPRPGLQRRISNAFALLRTKSDTRMNNFASEDCQACQGSQRDLCTDDQVHRPKSSGHDSRASIQIPTDTVRLEFSNYAHVEVRRRGTMTHRRYDVEYWGVKYHWRRLVLRDGEDEQICYHLTRTGSTDVLAKIMPEPSSPLEQRHEERKGAWVPRCAMWISDETVLHSQDVSDVLVASGLVALVDDSIRRHFGSHRSTKRLAMSILGRQSQRKSLDAPPTCSSSSGPNTVSGDTGHVRFAGMP